jgi:NAD(P)H-hydrate repair Nnr-like enzyme with NAD(P)H-hydrate epimerase domain
MRALTAQQMRDADAAAVRDVGEVALMRAAGDGLAEALAAIAPDARRIVAFAGPGNNGGDAYAAFAALSLPCECIVYALPAPNPSVARRDAEERAAARGTLTRPFPHSRAPASHSMRCSARAPARACRQRCVSRRTH